MWNDPKNMFGTFHRLTDSLVTGDRIVIGYKRGIVSMAQLFTRKDRGGSPFLSDTLPYKRILLHGLRNIL